MLVFKKVLVEGITRNKLFYLTKVSKNGWCILAGLSNKVHNTLLSEVE